MLEGFCSFIIGKLVIEGEWWWLEEVQVKYKRVQEQFYVKIRDVWEMLENVEEVEEVFFIEKEKMIMERRVVRMKVEEVRWRLEELENEDKEGQLIEVDFIKKKEFLEFEIWEEIKDIREEWKIINELLNKY